MIPKSLKPLLRPFRPYYFPIIYKKKDQSINKKFFNYFLTKNDVVIEVGARIGEITLILSDFSRYVYAFEPNLESYKILKSFTKKRNNITTFDFALGNISGFNWLNTIDNDPISLAASFKKIQGKNYSSKNQVKMKKIDDIIFSNSPNTLVIDCEGYELEVLEGAKNTVKRIEKIAVETHILDDQTNTMDSVTSFLNDWFEIEIKKFPDDNPWIVAKNKNLLIK